MLRAFALATALAVLGPTAARADAYGAAFHVNGSRNANLATPSNLGASMQLAQGANGDSIMLWNSGPAGAETHYIARYDLLGRPLANSGLNVGNEARRVAVAGNGNFAILGDYPDGSGSGVFLTIYNRAGAVLVPRFRVNDTTAGEQRASHLVINAAGMITVGWYGPAPASCPSLYVKRFHANGGFVASETMVFQTAAPGARLSGFDVALDRGGNSVAVWSYFDIYSGAASGVWGQRIGANGAPVGAPFTVNTTGGRNEHGPAVALSATGTFTITWLATMSGGNDALFARRYSAAGAALGGEIALNPGGPAIEYYALAMDANGGFVVATIEASGIIEDVVGRAYLASGAPLGAPIVVAAPSQAWPIVPRIGMDGAGNFLIGWMETHFSNQQPNDFYARRYSPAGTTITPLANGQLVSGLSGGAGSWRYYKLTVPSGHATVDAAIWGGTGDADLYLRLGALPTLTAWDGRPYLAGNSEGARMLNFPAGDWYIAVQGFSAYSGLNLQASSR